MKLISDAIQGFVILSILAAIYGVGGHMLAGAATAYDRGIMSYEGFTELLLEP